MNHSEPEFGVSDVSDRTSWLRRTGVVVSIATLLLGAGSQLPVGAQDADGSGLESVDAQANVESPPRELTTGEVDDDSLFIIEEYRIDGDQLVPNGDTPIPALTQKVWDRYASLFPAASRPEIDLFVGIDQEGSNGTDGALQNSALDPDKRYLALDVSGAVEFKELTRTMIHETAHLLQFRPSALQPGTKGEFCDVYDGGEGCPKEGSYLRLWDLAFYPGVTDGEDYPQEESDIEARYSPDAYVTDNYSATNPAEDMAETFAEWVLLDAPTGPSFVNNDPHYPYPVTGNRVIDQKLRFFDQFPELVALRANIREQLGLAALVPVSTPNTTAPPSSSDSAPSSDDNAPVATPLAPTFTG
ncbi:MAG: hypothetical protein R2704_09770 [Microthrixaceae bacterium]